MRRIDLCLRRAALQEDPPDKWNARSRTHRSDNPTSGMPLQPRIVSCSGKQDTCTLLTTLLTKRLSADCMHLPYSYLGLTAS